MNGFLGEGRDAPFMGRWWSHWTSLSRTTIPVATIILILRCRAISLPAPRFIVTYVFDSVEAPYGRQTTQMMVGIYGTSGFVPVDTSGNPRVGTFSGGCGVNGVTQKESRSKRAGRDLNPRLSD